MRLARFHLPAYRTTSAKRGNPILRVARSTFHQRWPVQVVWTTYVLETGIAREWMLRLHHIVLENELVLMSSFRLDPIDIIGIMVRKAVEDYRIDTDQHGIFSVQSLEDRGYKCSQKNDKAHSLRKFSSVERRC